MRDKETKVYLIDELSESAQHAAYESHMRHFDYFWADDNLASLKGFCESFDCQYRNFEYGGYRGAYCDLKASLVSDPNDSWPGYPGDGPPDMTGTRLRTWILNNFHHVLYTRKVYRLGSWGGKSRKSRITFEESCCPFTGYCMDYPLLQPIRDFIARPNKSTTWAELLQDCMSQWAHDCNADYEHCTSFESFLEDARANGWEYDEDGIPA